MRRDKPARRATFEPACIPPPPLDLTDQPHVQLVTSPSADADELVLRPISPGTRLSMMRPREPSPMGLSPTERLPSALRSHGLASSSFTELPASPKITKAIHKPSSAGNIYAHMKAHENSYLGLRNEISLARAEAALLGPPAAYKPWRGPAKSRRSASVHPQLVQRPKSALGSHLFDLERLEATLDRRHERSLSRLERKDKLKQRESAQLMRQRATSAAALHKRQSSPRLAAHALEVSGALRAVRSNLDQKLRRVIDLFREADANSDGTLTRKELAEVLRGAGLSTADVDMDAFFESLDENADGRISYDEMTRALRKVRADANGAAEAERAPVAAPVAAAAPRGAGLAIVTPSPTLSSSSRSTVQLELSLDEFSGLRTGEAMAPAPPKEISVGRRLWNALAMKSPGSDGSSSPGSVLSTLAAARLQPNTLDSKAAVIAMYKSIGATDEPLPCAYTEAAAAAAAAVRRRENMPNTAISAFKGALIASRTPDPVLSVKTADDESSGEGKKYPNYLHERIYTDDMSAAWKDDIITQLSSLPTDWKSKWKQAKSAVVNGGGRDSEAQDE